MLAQKEPGWVRHTARHTELVKRAQSEADSTGIYRRVDLELHKNTHSGYNVCFVQQPTLCGYCATCNHDTYHGPSLSCKGYDMLPDDVAAIPDTQLQHFKWIYARRITRHLADWGNDSPEKRAKDSLCHRSLGVTARLGSGTVLEVELKTTLI